MTAIQRSGVPALVAPTPLVLPLVGLTLVLMGLLNLALVQGAIAADLSIAALGAWWMVASPEDDGKRLGRLVLLPATLILGASLVAAAPNGFAVWSIRDLVLDVSAMLTFLCVYGAASGFDARAWRFTRVALGIGLGAVVVFLVLSVGPSLRAFGSFPNPNLAGHYIVTVTATLILLSDRRRSRVIIGAVGVIAWSLTGSFGALLQALAMIGYVAWRRTRPAPVVVASLVLGSLLLAGAAAASGFGLGSVTIAGVSTERLERSGGGRFQHWLDGVDALAERPWGVGPGGVNGLGYAELELHNEPLAYLVERGPLALAGLALLAATLWRFAPRDGAARILAIGFAVAVLFRETSHYRHLWICLALLLAFDRWRTRELAS